MEAGRALQDVLKMHCFGCGSLNERRLQIKSHWHGTWAEQRTVREDG